MSDTDEDEALTQEFFLRTSGTGDGLWELNRPQATIVKLAEQGVFHGEILDIGCGISDNAIYIAQHVKDAKITAIDLVRNTQILQSLKSESVFFVGTESD